MSSRYCFREFASITPTYTSFYSVAMEQYNFKKKTIPKIVVKRADNRSIKRLQTALYYMIITSPIQTTYCKELKRHVKFRLNFITLTLSDKQKHDDSFIKKEMLDRFLKWIVYKGASGYVWKAETQKNGNLHFHITTNKYIHHADIRSYWNSIQARHGYIDNYLSAYGNNNPNSTDVHAIKAEIKALKYMSKYMIKKQTDRREVDGHDFGYSRNLANVRICFPTDDPEFLQVAEYLESLNSYKMRFDYVTVMAHDLIQLKDCPNVLKDAILNGTKPKERKPIGG